MDFNDLRQYNLKISSDIELRFAMHYLHQAGTTIAFKKILTFVTVNKEPSRKFYILLFYMLIMFVCK